MNVPLTPLAFLERARRVYGPLDAITDGEAFRHSDLKERVLDLLHLLVRINTAAGALEQWEVHELKERWLDRWRHLEVSYPVP